MKRIDNISRTPLVSQFQSTTQGLTTARAFGILEDAIKKTDFHIDQTSRAFLGFQYSNRWIAFRLDYVTTTIITLCAFLIVFFASALNPALGGLVLTQALATAGILQFGTRQAAELEAQFTSVERLRHFVENTPREKQIVSQEIKPLSSTWPHTGKVEFRDFSARYREGLPLVLNGLSFTIAGGNRAALIGRTGSGKSTSILCLFRIIEAAGGHILIDDLDIAGIPLKTLRAKALSVVPQDAILFAGTIRFNLDPFNEYSDDAIWSALEKVSLKKYVSSLAVELSTEHSANGKCSVQPTTGLDYELSEGGSNLSSGQRQLFCFARALLKNSPIICIDEGTSSVDETSDNAIQETLKNSLAGRTLLIVAHRLNTVRHVDTICVLGEGKLLEIGSPDELLANPDSHFKGMWEASLHGRRNELSQN